MLSLDAKLIIEWVEQHKQQFGGCNPDDIGIWILINPDEWSIFLKSLETK